MGCMRSCTGFAVRICSNLIRCHLCAHSLLPSDSSQVTVKQRLQSFEFQNREPLRTKDPTRQTQKKD